MYFFSCVTPARSYIPGDARMSEVPRSEEETMETPSCLLASSIFTRGLKIEGMEAERAIDRV